MKTSPLNSNKVKLSSRNVPCSVDCFSPHGISKNKRKWLDEHDLYEATINEFKRVVTPVRLVDEKKDEPPPVIYMMDAVTGSLYDIPTGRCLTSSALVMKDFVAKKGLEKRLLALRTDINRGLL